MESNGITIECVPTAGATPEQVANSGVFRQWLDRLRAKDIILHGVRVMAAHWWGDPYEIKMIHLVADAADNENRALDGVVTLRGKTVDVLAIVTTPESRAEYLILVIQPRVAGAQARVVSNPSGMIDGSEHFSFAALRELNEELGEKISWCSPIVLTPPFTWSPYPLLVSPGGSDELVWLVRVHAEITHHQLARLQHSFAGATHEGERTQVLVVPFEDAPRRMALVGHACAKTLLSYMLYKHSAERQERICP